MSDNQQPHELYMKLTSLEIERSRRATERDATKKRLQVIDDRIGEIETEQKEIKAKLKVLDGGSPPVQTPQRNSVQNSQLHY
jgi:hypothetical protein